MAYIGGMRARLVKDSAFATINKALSDLHWFDPNRDHSPIIFLAEPHMEPAVVEPNTLTLVDENWFAADQELGSLMVEQRWTFVVDFYAENSAVGIHLANDVAAIVNGRMPSIGRDGPVFAVKDYSLGVASPPTVFSCQIENVTVGRAKGTKPFQQFWYYVTFDVLDYYWSELDA